MKRYRVPPDLRRRFRDDLDVRLSRALRIWGGTALVVLVIVWLVPARRHTQAPARAVPRERSARALVPPQLQAAARTPPRPVAAAPVPPAPRPAPPAPRKANEAPRQAKASAPQPQRGQPDAPVTGGGGARAGSPGPVAGQRGRDAAAQVTASVASATAGVDQLLASLQGTVPVAGGGGASGGGTSAVGALRSGLQGGRGSEALAGIDNLLAGTGAGKGGGPARGVAKGGIDVVDDGIASTGEGSNASGRDSRSLMAVVERYKSGVKFCYDNALKKSGQLAGKITLQIDIAASGEVIEVQVVHDGLGDAALQRCIQTQVLSWRFPAIEAGTVRFTLPLVFSPPHG